jgi:hypothetical protein
MPTLIPTKIFRSIPTSLTTRRDRVQAGTDHEFTTQLAAVPMKAWYISNRRGPELRSVAGHLTTAVRLPRAHGHRRWWGSGVMRPFCPDGYVLAQEAILRAALCWFPEEISALEAAAANELALNNRPDADVNALTPVEHLARALEPAASFSDGLRQQFVHLLTEAEHRLRNLLHQGALMAFYFGGLFDQGRHAVDREFWATPEADGVLMSGSYWPFSKPRAWHEQRPSFPLCFLETELAKLLSESSKSPPRRGGNRRGPKPTKLEQVKQAMRQDFSQASELQNMPEKELAAKYNVSRDTARKARNDVLPTISDKSIVDKMTTNDK